MSYWLPVGLSRPPAISKGERVNVGEGVRAGGPGGDHWRQRGGAVLGTAASNANNANSYPTVGVAPTVTSEPAVTVNSTTCYYTHRWINGVRHRVRVCTGQPVAAVPAPAVVPERYGYGAAGPAYGYGYYATAPAGHCDVISGQRVCFP